MFASEETLTKLLLFEGLMLICKTNMLESGPQTTSFPGTRLSSRPAEVVSKSLTTHRVSNIKTEGRILKRTYRLHT